MTEKKKIKNIIDLLVNAVIFVSTGVAWSIFFFGGGSGNMPGINFDCFRYYTIDSNLLCGIVSAITIVWNVKKLKNIDIEVPEWLRVLRLAGTVSVFLTFMVVMCFLGPTQGFAIMVEGPSLAMHITTPILAVVSYLFSSSEDQIYKKHILGAAGPTVIYGIVYMIMVVFIGREKGGWVDFYGFNIGGLWPITYVVILGFTVGVSYGFARLHWKINCSADGTDRDFFEGFSFSGVQDISPIEQYTASVYKSVLIVCPVAALCAGLTFTVMKICGLYPEVSTPLLIVFDVTCVLYSLLAFIYIKKSFDENGKLIPKMLKTGKIALVVLMGVQWNYISYMIPSVDFWAYSFFFIILSAFFFDYKMTDATSAIIIVSTAVSWIIKQDALIAPADGHRIENMVLRIVCILLSAVSLHLITFFGGSYLVRSLKRSSDYDALTKLRNRRRMDEIIGGACVDAYKKGTDVSLVLFDIDNFKQFNDKYSHEFGDVVLVTASNIIKDTVGDLGTVFRWGGEEILVLYVCPDEEAVKNAEQVRRNIQNQALRTNDNQIVGITITGGVAHFRADKNMEELFNEADSNLIAGKNSGKNVIIET